MLGLAGSQKISDHLELSLCISNGEKLLLSEAGMVVKHLTKDLDKREGERKKELGRERESKEKERSRINRRRREERGSDGEGT